MLKLQLFTQAALLALALGFSIGNVKGPSEGIIDLLLLVFPISAIFAALYVVEDRLVVHFCEYVGTLSEREQELARVPESELIRNSEISRQLKDFAKSTLYVRLFAQVVAFLLIPVALTVYRFVQVKANGMHNLEVAMDILLLVAILGLISWAFAQHRGTAVRAEFADGA